MRKLNLPNPKIIRKKLKSSIKVLIGHKIILLATLGVGIFVAGSLRFRVYLTQMASSNTGISLSHFSLPYLPAPSPLIYPSPSPSPSANDAVLGAQTDSNTTAGNSIGGYTPPSPYPSPIPTPTPIPSYTPPPTYVASPTPQPANSNSSSQSCSNPGVPTYQNSVVYNPAAVSLGSTAYFYIRLEDCNWSTPSVTDTLNITLVSGDPSVKVNGGDLRPTTTVTTTKGEASIPVWASVAGTYTFKITDVTSGKPIFDVTTDNPPYGAPIATFTAVAASSPSPTPSPSASPALSPSPTPSSPTPTPSPSPSASPSNSPSPSPSPSPSASP